MGVDWYNPLFLTTLKFRNQYGHCSKWQIFGPEFARIQIGARRVHQNVRRSRGRLTESTPEISY